MREFGPEPELAHARVEVERGAPVEPVPAPTPAQHRVRPRIKEAREVDLAVEGAAVAGQQRGVRFGRQRLRPQRRDVEHAGCGDGGGEAVLVRECPRRCTGLRARSRSRPCGWDRRRGAPASRIPAPARRGPSSRPTSAKAMSAAIVHTVKEATLPRRAPIVSARWLALTDRAGAVRRSVPAERSTADVRSALTSPRPFVKRRIARRRTRAVIHATSSIKPIRAGLVRQRRRWPGPPPRCRSAGRRCRRGRPSARVPRRLPRARLSGSGPTGSSLVNSSRLAVGPQLLGFRRRHLATRAGGLSLTTRSEPRTSYRVLDRTSRWARRRRNRGEVGGTPGFTRDGGRGPEGHRRRGPPPDWRRERPTGAVRPRGSETGSWLTAGSLGRRSRPAPRAQVRRSAEG